MEKQFSVLVLMAILIAFAGPLGLKIKAVVTNEVQHVNEIGSDEMNYPNYKLSIINDDTTKVDAVIDYEQDGLLYAKVSGDNIKQYYTTEKYPTINRTFSCKEETHGYIFAGWYSKSNGNYTSMESFPTSESYAKFVDDTVLSVKSQINVGTTKDSPKTNIRFLTSVDSLNYQKIGFDIKYGKKILHHESQKVLKTIYGSDGKTISAKNPTEVFKNNISRSFMSLEMNGVPQNAYNLEFEVTPYWITQNGTKVYGKTLTTTVNDNIINYLFFK